MFIAHLKWPAHLTDAQVFQFSESLCLPSLSLSTRREEGGVIAQWVLEQAIEAHDVIARIAVALADYDDVQVDVKPEDWDIQPLKTDTDWLTHNYEPLEPFTVSRFFIHDQGFEGDAPDGLFSLQIKADSAFGSGAHPTTKGCLQAMAELKTQGVCPWNVLDMGTGSGILALAGWKLWKTPILAVDNDPRAVDLALAHQEINKIPGGASNVIIEHSEGCMADSVQRKAPYELIIANVLAGILRDMAIDLVHVMDRNSYIILSGIIEEQVAKTQDIFEKQGLTLKKSYDIDGWHTLIMHRS